MAYLGDLLVRLKAETADFQQDLGKAAHIADQRAREIQQSIGKVEAAVASLGLSAIVAQKALEFKGVVDSADNFNKLSQKINMTVESVSALSFAASLADVDGQTFAKGMRDFNRALVEAQDPASKMGQLFRELGVNINAAPRDALLQFADAFAKLPEGPLRTEAAMQVLKKAGGEFIPFLLQGSQGIEDLTGKAQKLGVVISAEFAGKAEAFNDNLKMLSESSKALYITIGEKTVPAMVMITNNIVEATLKGEKWIGMLKEAAKLYAALWSMMPGPGGAVGNWAAGKLFAETPNGRSVSGKISSAPAPAPAAPDQEAVACILSGGKWVGGKCQRATQGGGAGKAKDDGYVSGVFSGAMADLNALQKLLDKTPIEKTRELLDNVKKLDDAFASGALSPQLYDQAITALTGKLEDGSKALEKLQEAGARVFMDTRTPLELFYIKMEELNMLLNAGAIDWDTYERAGGKALDAMKEKGDDTFKALENAIRGWGNQFTNVLADAVTGGKANFTDLANSIVRDLARIQIQKNITDPLLKAGTGVLDGLFKGGDLGSAFGNLFGGGEPAYYKQYAAGGRPDVGVPSIVGENGPELFTPDVAGTITPNHALGGGGVTIINNLTQHVDSRTDVATIASISRSIMRESEARTRQKLANRGQGALAGALA